MNTSVATVGHGACDAPTTCDLKELRTWLSTDAGFTSGDVESVLDLCRKEMCECVADLPYMDVDTFPPVFRSRISQALPARVAKMPIVKMANSAATALHSDNQTSAHISKGVRDRDTPSGEDPPKRARVGDGTIDSRVFDEYSHTHIPDSMRMTSERAKVLDEMSSGFSSLISESSFGSFYPSRPSATQQYIRDYLIRDGEWLNGRWSLLLQDVDKWPIVSLILMELYRSQIHVNSVAENMESALTEEESAQLLERVRLFIPDSMVITSEKAKV